MKKTIIALLTLLFLVIGSSCNAYHKLSSSYKPEPVKCRTYNDTKPHFVSTRYKPIKKNYPKTSYKNQFNPYKQYK